jgi:hypothetical protein
MLHTLDSVMFLLSFVAFAISFYYMCAFHWLWREYMRSRGLRETTIWRLSPFAIFWQNIPEQCNIRRRRLSLAMAAFCVLCGLSALVIAAERSSGFSN